MRFLKKKQQRIRDKKEYKNKDDGEQNYHFTN